MNKLATVRLQRRSSGNGISGTSHFPENPEASVSSGHLGRTIDEAASTIRKWMRGVVPGILILTRDTSLGSGEFSEADLHGVKNALAALISGSGASCDVRVQPDIG